MSCSSRRRLMTASPPQASGWNRMEESDCCIRKRFQQSTAATPQIAPSKPPPLQPCKFGDSTQDRTASSQRRKGDRYDSSRIQPCRRGASDNTFFRTVNRFLQPTRLSLSMLTSHPRVRFRNVQNDFSVFVKPQFWQPHLVREYGV
jgi:hypothetical protein